MRASTETISRAIPRKVEELASAVLKATRDRRLRLATAGGCSGGLLAALLTDIDGCSHAFERGFVSCTDDAKHEMLDVDAGLWRAASYNRVCREPGTAHRAAR